MEKGKYSLLRHVITLLPIFKKLACVITSRPAADVQNFVAIGLAVSAPIIHDFAVPFDAIVFILRFLT